MANARRVVRLKCGTTLLCAFTLFALAGCGWDSSSNANSGSGPSAPTISGSPVTQAQVGQTYSFTPTVQQSSSSAVSFSIQNKPAWASFSIATGKLTGTPTNSDVGTYQGVVISVSNGMAASSLAPFTITVSQAATGSVTLSWTAPTTNTDGTPLTNLEGYTIDYGTSAASLDQSITIGSPSTTTATIKNLAAGTWYFSVSAYTTDGVQSQQSGVVSTTVN